MLVRIHRRGISGRPVSCLIECPVPMIVFVHFLLNFLRQIPRLKRWVRILADNGKTCLPPTHLNPTQNLPKLCIPLDTPTHPSCTLNHTHTPPYPTPTLPTLRSKHMKTNMGPYTRKSSPDTEHHPKDPQVVTIFMNLMRACIDPIDIENLRNFRAETHDFQVAINMFAMFKARESSERYNMPERVRERKMLEEKEKEEKKEKEKEKEKAKEKAERAIRKLKEGELQRYTLVANDSGRRTSEIMTSRIGEGVGLGIFTPRVVQGDDLVSVNPRVVEGDNLGSITPRVLEGRYLGEVTPRVVEEDRVGSITPRVLEGRYLGDVTPRVVSGSITPRVLEGRYLGDITPRVVE